MSKQLEVIHNVIKSMDQNGLLQRVQGNCVTASDILSNLLYQQGVTSYVTEVTATAYKNEIDTILIGFDGLFPQTDRKDQIDTHVVVITNGETPMLIDISIGNLFGSHKHVVITPVLSNTFIEGTINSKKIVYSIKETPKLISLHEKSFIQRIQRESKLVSDVSVLKLMIISAAALGFVNFIINIILYITKT